MTEDVHASVPTGASMVEGCAVDTRPLMASFPTGVAVITAIGRDGAPWGMTCTSLCSVSLQPPILLVCLRSGSPTLEAVSSGGAFAVNLLHSQARATAQLFASGDRRRFDRVVWTAEANAAGPHLVTAAHTVADCTVISADVVGDHTVIMGHVLAVKQLREQRPLLYGLRRYVSWQDLGDEGYLSYDFIS